MNIWIIVFSFSISYVLNAQQYFLNQFITKYENQGAKVGLVVIDIDKDSIIYSHNSQIPLLPASTLKLITTGLGIHFLGKDYQFITDFAKSGNNLYINPSYDPTLGSNDFENSADKILKEIQTKFGKVNQLYFNCSGISCTPEFWGEQNLGNYYGARAHPFNWRNNEYSIVFYPYQYGKTPKILNTSPTTYYTFDNQLITSTSNSGDRAYIYESVYDTFKVIKGTIPESKGTFIIRGSISNPMSFFANELNASIKYSFNFPRKYDTIISYKSPSLTEISAYTNKHSNNMYSESILYALTNGDRTHALNYIEDFFNLYLKIPSKEFHVEDGCGLSRLNTVSPNAMVSFLKFMALDSKNFKFWYEGLPVAGAHGSVKWLLRNSYLNGNARIKSGHLDGVRTYAGYYFKPNGQRLAFAIMVNDFEVSNSQMSLDIKKALEVMLK